MNTSTIIGNKELDLLKTMVGKTFDKYKCDPFINTPMVYGIAGIYIDGKPFKITSLLKEVHRFLTIDDVAEFKIIETPDGKKLYGNYKGVRVVVIKTNGKIATVFPDSDQSSMLKKRRR